MADTTIIDPEVKETDVSETDTPIAETAPAVEVPRAPAEQAGDGNRSPRGRGRESGGRSGGRSRERAPRERSEFEQVTVDVRRVARVMAGGRRFSFSVTVVIGDRKGRVGVGIGKAADTALAIDKAVRDAKRHLITVARTKSGSIAHEVSSLYASSVLTMVPSPGRGLVAGSAMRTVLEYAGVTDVIGKILSRTKNKLTIARATVVALQKLRARPSTTATLSAPKGETA